MLRECVGLDAPTAISNTIVQEQLGKCDGKVEEKTKPRSRRKSSSYRGVSRCAKDGAYQARIRIGKTVKYLGRFKTEHEAAAHYDEAAKVYHGDRAVLNFPQTGESTPRNSNLLPKRELEQAKDSEPVKKKAQRRGTVPTMNLASRNEQNRRKSIPPNYSLESTSAEDDMKGAIYGLMSLTHPPREHRLFYKSKLSIDTAYS